MKKRRMRLETRINEALDELSTAITDRAKPSVLKALETMIDTLRFLFERQEERKAAKKQGSAPESVADRILKKYGAVEEKK